MRIPKNFGLWWRNAKLPPIYDEAINIEIKKVAIRAWKAGRKDALVSNADESIKLPERNADNVQ